MSHDRNSVDINVTIGINDALDALLTKLIAAWQGHLPPADQALLDGLLVRAAGLTAAEESLAAKTPPKP